jgi:hypothetical protein
MDISLIVSRPKTTVMWTIHVTWNLGLGTMCEVIRSQLPCSQRLRSHGLTLSDMRLKTWDPCEMTLHDWCDWKWECVCFSFCYMDETIPNRIQRSNLCVESEVSTIEPHNLRNLPQVSYFRICKTHHHSKSLPVKGCIVHCIAHGPGD